MKEFALMIDGQRRSTAATQDVRNPSTGAVVGRMPMATTQDLDAAVAAANRAFRSWSETPDAVREAACLAIADRIEAHAEELAKLITLEQGKQLNGLGSRFEVGGTVAWTRHTAGLQLEAEILQETSEGRI